VAWTLVISPLGRLHLEERSGAAPDGLTGPADDRIVRAFAAGPAAGLLHLGTTELQTPLPLPFGYARDFARSYLTRLCQTPGLSQGDPLCPIPPPSVEELGFLAIQAPPMKGLEYLNAAALSEWWAALDGHVRGEIAADGAGAAAAMRT